MTVMSRNKNRRRPSASPVAVSRRLRQAGHVRWDIAYAYTPGFVVASHGKDGSIVTHDPGRLPFGAERARLIEEALEAYAASLEAVGYTVHRQSNATVFGWSLRVARGATDPA